MSGRARAVLVALIVGLFLIAISFRGIANFYTDYLWFDAIQYDSVWRRVLFAKIALAVIFTLLFAAVCWVNLWLADRLAPQYREPSPEEEAIGRLREVVGHRWGLIRIGITALFALSIGAGAASQWRNWLLFRNSVDFGEVDPQFGRDISFYAFRMPFWTWLMSWLFTALLVIVVLTILMHYLAGGIRIQSLGERVTPQVKAHLSSLLALLALIRAGGYWFDRFALAYSSDGKFAGLGYTDVRARLPVLSLLILIALLSVVLFLVNIRRRGWGLPAVAVGLWALASIVMGGLYPLAVQRLSVNPDETTKEAEFIARNIEATKLAYNLGTVEQRVFNYEEDLSGADLQGNSDNIITVPLLDPGVSARTFELQQVERSFFRFDASEIDVDRYMIGDKPTPVLISARELNSGGIPESGWESEVLSFTHGNGIALAPANDIRESLPVFLIGDVPIENSIEGDVPIDQPRVYYGENMSSYAIVNTDRDEVDGVADGARIPYNYDGIGGVESNGFWRKFMFAWRFQSIDPLISDFVRDDSRFIWNRNIAGRVNKVAPFIEFDHNPYPVVLDGRVVYVVDGYTTTDKYPYSEPRAGRDIDRASGLRANFNYVRNSVKAVVDAYDGTVSLYVVDKTDPIIQVWAKAFPEIFIDFEEMPEELHDNLRYPEDLFRVQTNMWAVYHIDIDETADLLEGSDEWAVAQDPGGVQGAGIDSTINAQGVTSSSEVRVDPYYSLLRLPEENQQEFVIMRTFVPFSNDDAVKELKAFMVGVSEVGSAEYGRLVSYEVENDSGDNEAPGPGLVASQITSQEQVSQQISLLNAAQEGSSVEFGDLVVVPVEDSLVYVRPLYVIATGTEQPNLEWVIVSHADNVVMCHSLADALDALFGVEVPGLERGGVERECIGDVAFDDSNRPAVVPDTTDEPRTNAPIVIGEGPAADEAFRLLTQAETALDDGDLGRYQELVEAALQVLTEAADAGGG